ncbi:hypothetical protein LR48_Vigan561s002700 [Vigna angularis]|uniref:Nucleoside phosphorylase domain-containing protein n=1 Tax=Phaseolus angularis TaxID=3914 RepID=A0A0L9TDP7_PHAAN|nr:hypothetical protein LR48_Vigan561s002700 [Vigna angularis]
MYVFLAAFLFFNIAEHASVSCALTSELQRKIEEANKKGPYLGLIIPNSFELSPLLQNPGYTPYDTVIDFAGKRFRFGAIGDKPVILVMTGLSLINAGITTQLLLSFFAVEGVVHHGIAGNANPSLHIGDRHGLGPDDTLPLEDNGDYTRNLGFLKFADFTTNVSDDSSADNQLNNIWYQPEEIFPVDGVPEERQHAFWIPVDSNYYRIAEKLQGLKLESCVNSTTCLSSTPKIQFVKRGISQSIYVDNSAYRTFIYNKFDVSPVDMETASVALICLQQRIPFIAIRALSDLAGGGSAESNEADTFLSIAAANSVTAVIEFVKLLSSH